MKAFCKYMYDRGSIEKKKYILWYYKYTKKIPPIKEDNVIFLAIW